MHKFWSDEAWQEYLYWQMQDKKTLKRFNLLIQQTATGMTVLASRSHWEKIGQAFGADALMKETGLSTVFGMIRSK